MKKLLSTTLIALGLCAGVPTSTPVQAGANPFLGEITWFGGNFAPRGWAFCDGQLLPISSYSALFSLLGTVYGGDGRTTFALPDMRGRTIIHEGSGPGLSTWTLGEKAGAETHTMTVSNLASHNHTATLKANASAANIGSPNGTVLGAGSIYFRGASDTNMGASSITVANTGNQQPFSIIQPSLAVNCVIALQGVFPSRN